MNRRLVVAVASAMILAAGSAAAQDFSLTPTYGQVSLNTGFLPDPYSVGLQSGGSINASSLGGGCNGYIANAPDFRVNYTAGSLPLIISVIASADTTLVVNGPNGQWYCDDDSGDGLNPVVRFDGAQSGQYDIWVGTYGSASLQPGTLYISELAAGPGGGGGQTAGGPDLSAAPTYGSTSLTAGFANDPRSVSLQSGGSINASTNPGGTCRGYIASAPDYQVFYTAGSFPLILSVVASADTTLVVNGPNGQWTCADDTEGLNPVVRFDSPQSGRYDIWVGTYGSASLQPATLYISELASGPGGGGGGGGGGASSGGGFPDISLSPTYGSTTLSAGFANDPRTVALQSGGSIDASAALGGNCRGYIATAPDYQVFYTSGSFPLILSVNSSSDTTLVINDPNGNWVCDDDTGNGLNPSVRFNSPQSGRYDIYVGTYGGASLQSATLYISELTSQ